MRKTVLSLMSIAAMALAGCNAPNSSQQTGTDAPSSTHSVGDKGKTPSEVGGTISLRAGTPQPSADATLVLNLANVSSSAAGAPPLATKTAPAGSFPQPFKLSFNPADVKPNDLYVVQVILTDGDRHYSMPIQAPVLAKGSNNDSINIQLVAEQTPSEKLLADFNAEKQQLGAMKVALDRAAIEYGLNGIAYPADGMVAYAREQGLDPEFYEYCCSLTWANG